MDSESRNQIRQLVALLLRLDTDRRKLFLDTYLGDHANDLPSMITMLRTGDLAPPAPPRSKPRPPSEASTIEEDEGSQAVPQVRGYVVREQVGEGTFGNVYKAERIRPIRQPVALKILKPGWDSAHVLARFEAERQALALMQHRNIARIYDAGTVDDGRPYFAMEFIAGLPVTDHCDRNRLDLKERLQLFTAICDGIQHAHQKGVIHRDLKPSNILVQYEDELATPKIIDFGVAKALNHPLTERTLFTQQGALVGTPEYMSPEQAELTAQDVDTRADIYSLGVLLYQMLTGALPFDRRELLEVGFDGMLRLIRDADPPKPSTRLRTLDSSDPEGSGERARRRGSDPRTLMRRVAGDLDWITMKCLEKDRAHRYASANELAADVRRHLHEEPVLAGPPGVGYRARKFWRRHRKPLTAAGLMLVVVLAGLVTTTALVVRNSQLAAENDATRGAALLEEAALLMYERPRESRERLERAERLMGNVEAVRLARSRLYRREGRREEAIAECEKLLELNPESGMAMAFLAGLHVGERPDLSEQYRASAATRVRPYRLSLAMGLAQEDPAESIRLISESLDARPWNFEALWNRAVRRYQSRRYDDALSDARLLLKERPELSLTWNLLGSTLFQLSRSSDSDSRGALLDEAVGAFDRAIENKRDDWKPWFGRGLARIALESGEAALEDITQASRLAPQEPDPIRERVFLLSDLGRTAPALAAIDELLEIEQDDWINLTIRASLRTRSGERSGAIDDYTRALEQLGAEDRFDRADVLLDRAEVHLLEGEETAAREDVASADALAVDDAWIMRRLSRAFRRAGDHERSLVEARRAVELKPENALYRLELGVAEWIGGAPDRARENLEFFVERNPADGAWVRLWLWEIESRAGRRKAARRQLELAASSGVPLLEQVVDAFQEPSGIESLPDRATTDEERLYVYYALGVRAYVMGASDEASDWFGKGVSVGEPFHIEHDLARWHLDLIGSAPDSPAGV